MGYLAIPMYRQYMFIKTNYSLIPICLVINTFRGCLYILQATRVLFVLHAFSILVLNTVYLEFFIYIN